MKNKIIYEILVDKTNEKGASVFENILLVLHKVFEMHEKAENFSFEISKIGGKIRFFFITPKKYKEFLKNQIYAHFSKIEVLEVEDYLEKVPNDKVSAINIELSNHFFYPIKSFTNEDQGKNQAFFDPYSSITSAILKTGNYSINSLQINFQPISDKKIKKSKDRIISVLESKYPPKIKKILLHKYYRYLYYVFLPVFGILKLFYVIIFSNTSETDSETSSEGQKDKTSENSKDSKNEEFDEFNPFSIKFSKPFYDVSVNIFCASEDKIESKFALKETFSTLSVFSGSTSNSLKVKGGGRNLLDEIKNRQFGEKFILNTSELASLVHLPTSYVTTPSINWISSRKFESPSNLPLISKDENLLPIGETNFRGHSETFGMGVNDRRRHVYIIGKTGMGKSTLLENMIIEDMQAGRGVGVIDPHGDLAEAVIGHVPRNRTNSTIIFDPSDIEWPIAFNMFDNVPENSKSIIASGIVGIFKKIFGESRGPRLEHILRNTILALMDYPNTTLISIPMMLTSEYYRKKVVAKIKNPLVKKFWQYEFENLTPQNKLEYSSPILNKVGQFLSSPLLRNILGQNKNSFDLRYCMDTEKIIVVNLSKGNIGEDVSSLLGAMLVTKFQLDAMSRANIKESERKDFFLYVDEFQNFATDSFATILSEARKYRLSLVMANQFINQMPETVRDAVFGNVGTLVSFQVGASDSAILQEIFGVNDIEVDDLVNLKAYNIYTKLLIDGMPSKVFSAKTLPPKFKNEEEFQIRYDKIWKVSREKYSKPKDFVEKKIFGMMKEIDEGETKLIRERIAEKEKKEVEKRNKNQEKKS